MKLVVEESDFAAIKGEAWAASMRGRPGALGPSLDADGKRRAILDLLPRALVDRIQAVIPPSTKLREIEFSVTLEGTPFDIEIDGTATFRLEVLSEP